MAGGFEVDREVLFAVARRLAVLSDDAQVEARAGLPHGRSGYGHVTLESDSGEFADRWLYALENLSEELADSAEKLTASVNMYAEAATNAGYTFSSSHRL